MERDLLVVTKEDLFLQQRQKEEELRATETGSQWVGSKLVGIRVLPLMLKHIFELLLVSSATGACEGENSEIQ